MYYWLFTAHLFCVDIQQNDLLCNVRTDEQMTGSFWLILLLVHKWHSNACCSKSFEAKKRFELLCIWFFVDHVKRLTKLWLCLCRSIHHPTPILDPQSLVCPGKVYMSARLFFHTLASSSLNHACLVYDHPLLSTKICLL